MDKKVSVIIPVYNAGKYVEQCIVSLLNQTLQSCEFIFVNDGSKDDSQKIIERYQKIDNRIKFINQENQGVSTARNTGLKAATGEYIGFVDADDYVEEDMYEMLYNIAKQNDCDVVISNLQSERDDPKGIIKYPFPMNVVLEKDYIELELLPYFLKEDNLNSVCNKIYKNQLVREANVQFPKSILLGEDGIFNQSFFGHAIRTQYIDYTGYNYREVEGSATRNRVEKDYFNRSLEVYKTTLPEIYRKKMGILRIQQLKSIKLIKNVMSYIYIYFLPSKDMSFRKRYKYIKKMVQNEYVKEALPIYHKQVQNALGRYEKCILAMMKREFILGLYCAMLYSRFRNK